MKKKCTFVQKYIFEQKNLCIFCGIIPKWLWGWEKKLMLINWFIFGNCSSPIYFCSLPSNSRAWINVGRKWAKADGRRVILLFLCWVNGSIEIEVHENIKKPNFVRWFCFVWKLLFPRQMLLVNTTKLPI